MNALNIEGIGKAIKSYRVQSGLTQSELAAKIGISSSAVGMYEQGRRTPPVDVLYNIASALNVNFIDLIPELKEEYKRNSQINLNSKIKKVEETLNNSNLKETDESNPKVDVIAAHLDSDKLSDDDLDDIQQFIQFVQSRKE